MSYSDQLTFEENNQLTRGKLYESLSGVGQVMIHELYELELDPELESAAGPRLSTAGPSSTIGRHDQIVVSLKDQFVKQLEHWLEKWVVAFDRNLDSEAVIHTLADRLGLSIVPDMDNENKMTPPEAFIYEFLRKLPNMKRKTPKTIGTISG